MGIMIDKSGKKFCDADVLGGGASQFGQGRTKGGGGSKKGKFLRTSYMDAPLPSIEGVHLQSFLGI